MNQQTDALLNYERRGSGPPLVLLHGIGHRWQAWEPVLGKLAAEHDVIAVDLPGFGKSAPLAAPSGMTELATAIRGFFERLGLDRPHVAGNSLGGAIALELAAGGHVRTATALSPAGFWARWEFRWALAALVALRRTTFLPVWLLRVFASRAWLRSLAFGMIVRWPARLSPERAMGDILAMRDCTAFSAVARQAHNYAFHAAPQVPATVAWGTRDRILLHRQAARARQRLPGARHVDLPGCGHVPMSDAPDLVASTILATTKEAPA
jgi:pimeloyl-ACP methyl ester carboxylesterase